MLYGVYSVLIPVIVTKQIVIKLIRLKFVKPKKKKQIEKYCIKNENHIVTGETVTIWNIYTVA